MLSKLIKWMRIDEKLSWNALEDRSRTITNKRGFTDLAHFVNQETFNFLYGYTRCLIQNQDKHIEIWTEKDALLRIFTDVVYPYCIRAVVCRGYSSVTFIADFYTRAEKAIMQRKQPVVLYFGDLDPSGVQMLEATIETLEDMIRKSIESEIDMDLFEEQKEQEDEDENKLDEIRDKVYEAINSALPDMFDL